MNVSSHARGYFIAKFFLCFVILLHPEIFAGSARAQNYLADLQNAITQSRGNLPALTQSAEGAAREFVAGGNLWAAGRQPDFVGEACERAGGLMAVGRLAQQVPANHDIVLYAVPGALDDSDRKIVDDWRTRDVTVVTFSSAAGLYHEKVPIDTVINVIELWVWTGEFVAACARLGKLPVLYQSYGLSGGYERATKYKGKRFHDDLTVKPIPTGILGNEYLDQIQRMLGRLQAAEMPRLDRAAEWWRNAKSSTVLVTGHMFPMHGDDPRAIRVCDFVKVPAREDKKLLDGNPPEFVLYLGYQSAPQKLLDEVKTTEIKLVYTDVQSGEPAQPSDNILYIAPGWPLSDGCVSVPGYDISILPASGVVQAGIYWTIVSKAFPSAGGSVLTHQH
jgi:hypothetical protein